MLLILFIAITHAELTFFTQGYLDQGDDIYSQMRDQLQKKQKSKITSEIPITDSLFIKSIAEKTQVSDYAETINSQTIDLPPLLPQPALPLLQQITKNTDIEVQQETGKEPPVKMSKLQRKIKEYESAKQINDAQNDRPPENNSHIDNKLDISNTKTEELDVIESNPIKLNKFFRSREQKRDDKISDDEQQVSDQIKYLNNTVDTQNIQIAQTYAQSDLESPPKKKFFNIPFGANKLTQPQVVQQTQADFTKSQDDESSIQVSSEIKETDSNIQMNKYQSNQESHLPLSKIINNTEEQELKNMKQEPDVRLSKLQRKIQQYEALQDKQILNNDQANNYNQQVTSIDNLIEASSDTEEIRTQIVSVNEADISNQLDTQHSEEVRDNKDLNQQEELPGIDSVLDKPKIFENQYSEPVRVANQENQSSYDANRSINLSIISVPNLKPQEDVNIQAPKKFFNIPFGIRNEQQNQGQQLNNTQINIQEALPIIDDSENSLSEVNEIESIEVEDVFNGIVVPEEQELIYSISEQENDQYLEDDVKDQNVFSSVDKLQEVSNQVLAEQNIESMPEKEQFQQLFDQLDEMPVQDDKLIELTLIESLPQESDDLQINIIELKTTHDDVNIEIEAEETIKANDVFKIEEQNSEQEMLISKLDKIVEVEQEQITDSVNFIDQQETDSLNVQQILKEQQHPYQQLNFTDYAIIDQVESNLSESQSEVNTQSEIFEFQLDDQQSNGELQDINPTESNHSLLNATKASIGAEHDAKIVKIKIDSDMNHSQKLNQQQINKPKQVKRNHTQTRESKLIEQAHSLNATNQNRSKTDTSQINIKFSTIDQLNLALENQSEDSENYFRFGTQEDDEQPKKYKSFKKIKSNSHIMKDQQQATQRDHSDHQRSQKQILTKNSNPNYNKTMTNINKPNKINNYQQLQQVQQQSKINQQVSQKDIVAKPVKQISNSSKQILPPKLEVPKNKKPSFMSVKQIVESQNQGFSFLQIMEKVDQEPRLVGNNKKESMSFFQLPQNSFNKNSVVNLFETIKEEMINCELNDYSQAACNICNSEYAFSLNEDNWYIIGIAYNLKRNFQNLLKVLQDHFNYVNIYLAFSKSSVCIVMGDQIQIENLNMIMGQYFHSSIEDYVINPFIVIPNKINGNYFQLQIDLNTYAYSNLILQANLTVKNQQNGFTINNQQIQLLDKKLNYNQTGMILYPTFTLPYSLKVSISPKSASPDYFEELRVNQDPRLMKYYIADRIVAKGHECTISLQESNEMIQIEVLLQ